MSDDLLARLVTALEAYNAAQTRKTEVFARCQALDSAAHLCGREYPSPDEAPYVLNVADELLPWILNVHSITAPVRLGVAP